MWVPSGAVEDGVLTIGSVSAPIFSAGEKMKVPDVLFYDNEQVSIEARYGRLSTSLIHGPANIELGCLLSSWQFHQSHDQTQFLGRCRPFSQNRGRLRV